MDHWVMMNMKMHNVNYIIYFIYQGFSIIIVICFCFFLFSGCSGEANKLIADYKYKLTKAEQEIASLQASLARSETQVIRYKSTADATEKAEADLKIERRKLQREVKSHCYHCLSSILFISAQKY